MREREKREGKEKKKKKARELIGKGENSLEKKKKKNITETRHGKK